MILLLVIVFLVLAERSVALSIPMGGPGIAIPSRCVVVGAYAAAFEDLKHRSLSRLTPCEGRYGAGYEMYALASLRPTAIVHVIGDPFAFRATAAEMRLFETSSHLETWCVANRKIVGDATRLGIRYKRVAAHTANATQRASRLPGFSETAALRTLSRETKTCLADLRAFV
jgi:hypothetical protein